MTEYSTAMAALYDWLVSIGGFDADKVYRRNQGNPDHPPGVNWATYTDIAGSIVDYPVEKKEPVGIAKEEIDTTRIFPGTSVISVNVYAENGADILGDLYESRTERAPRIALRDGGLVLVNRSRTRNLSLLSDTGWKARHQADFEFNVFSQRVERDYVVDIVNVTGKIEDETVEIHVDRNG